MLPSQTLLDLILAPFEEAMSSILGVLDAKQIEVFLFDDDRFLTNELKADGRLIIYNKQQDSGAQASGTITLPEFQDGQETIVEAPLFIEGRQIGHYRIRREILADFDRDRWLRDVELITPVAARIIEANHNRIQARKTYIDDLTEVYNRRKLSEQMGRLFKHFKTGQKKLFFALIDIDGFRSLNDTYGHLASDEVLKQAAQLFRNCVPYIYRYCSDIFCGVFYGFEKQSVLEMMENLRQQVEVAQFTVAGQERKITISCGIAEFEISMNSIADAIDRADKALYASKEDGRNLCSYYDDIKDRYWAEAMILQMRNLLLETQVECLRQQLTKCKSSKK